MHYFLLFSFQQTARKKLVPSFRTRSAVNAESVLISNTKCVLISFFPATLALIFISDTRREVKGPDIRVVVFVFVDDDVVGSCCRFFSKKKMSFERLLN